MSPRLSRTERRWALLVALLALIALALAAALILDANGNGEEEEFEGAAVACSGDPVEPNLPSDFPQVEGMTYTGSQTSGQSEIVDGYYEGDLQGAYDAWKEALEGAGYTITFDEIEERDSEVAYSGGAENRSGIVALRDSCTEEGRIAVHITSRPA